jgi:hypothetical protein
MEAKGVDVRENIFGLGRALLDLASRLVLALMSALGGETRTNPPNPEEDDYDRRHRG